MPNELLKELVALRVKRTLARKAGKETQYERNLYHYVGRGVTSAEYTEILDSLVGDGVVKRTAGERGAVILALAE